MFATFASKLAANPVVIRRLLIVLPSAGAGSYAVVSTDSQQVAYTVAVLPARLARDAWTAAAILADYKYTLWGLKDDEPRLDKIKAEVHQRGANRLLWLCQANGGIYAKLGQHLGMLDHLLPAEYVKTMREHMLDRCPVSPWSSVRKTLIEDLGAPPEEIFESIDTEPIASASLAQVHVATHKDGRKLAVKVQHRGLRETSNVDLKTIELLVKTVKLFAKSFDYMWLVEEANENLPKELNFLLEAGNAQRCIDNLNSPRSRVNQQGRGGQRVRVPDIDASLSSTRVLTMEFIDGVKVTDKEGLKALGVDVHSLARLISETFSEMIFAHGWVHSDPHPANMLVARAPSSGSSGTAKEKWQLVLLDHGLYRELDDAFRLEYAALWKALVFADVTEIERHAAAMNAADSVPIFAGMLTQRPWREVSKKQSVDRLKLQYTEEERDEIQLYAGQYIDEISDLLSKMPRQLLLLLKTNDCLRAVDMELGAGVNSYVITARECSRALAEQRTLQRPGLVSRVAAVKDRVAVEWRMFGLRILTWIAPLDVWVSAIRGTKQVD